MALTWREPVASRGVQLEAFGLQSIVARVDPYFAWAAAKGLVPRTFTTDDGRKEPCWYPVLIQLHGTTAEKFARAVNEPSANRPRSTIAWVPPWFVEAAPGLAGTTFVVAWVDWRFFSALATADSYVREHVQRFEFGMSDGVPPPEVLRILAEERGEHATASAVPPAPFAGSTPTPQRGDAIVAIVDDGIAFAHARFRGRNGTSRIVAFWDQKVPRTHPWTTVPTPVTHGVEWPADPPANKGLGTPASLNELLVAHLHADVVDEDALYAAAAQAQAGTRARHGTHVLDLAAGLDRQPGAPSPAIVAVQLPEPTAADASGRLLAPQLLDGVRFAIDRADRHAMRSGRAGPLPIVVNLSYGLNGGPHDGSSLLELALAEIVALREGDLDPPGATPAVVHPVSIVVAAGNSAQARGHVAFTLGAGERRTLRWRIPPDSLTSAYLELWFGHGMPDTPVPKVGVRLLAPTPTDDDAPTIVHPAFADPDADRRDFAQLTDTTWAETDNALADRLVAQVAWVAEGKGLASEPLSLYNDRDMVLAAIAPTAGLEAGRAWAPPGVWCVELSNEGSAAVEVHGWIRRNDTPFGSRAGGRQSWFEDVGYAVLRDDGRARVHDDPASDTPIRRTTTLNGIATGRNVVVVGAQREDDRSAAGYTAQGPTVPGSATEVVRRRGPDLIAPSDRSAARPGRLAAGTRSGSTVALNGTSVATPQVVRRIAEAFVAGAASTPEALAAVRVQLAAPVQQASDIVPSDVEVLRSGTARLRSPYRATREDPHDPYAP